MWSSFGRVCAVPVTAEGGAGLKRREACRPQKHPGLLGLELRRKFNRFCELKYSAFTVKEAAKKKPLVTAPRY